MKCTFAYKMVHNINQERKETYIKAQPNHVLKICQQQGQKVKKAATYKCNIWLETHIAALQGLHFFDLRIILVFLL